MGDRTTWRSFTLIELLVVLAVIVLLAALLGPVFAQVRAMARQAGCMAHLHQLVQAMHMYADLWDERLAGAGDYREGTGWITCPQPFVFQPEQGVLWPFTRNRALYHCPEATGTVSYSMNHALAYRSWAEVGAPAGVLLFLDEAEIGGFPNDGAFWPEHFDLDRLTDRHHGGGVVAWLDGHVTWRAASGRFDLRPFDPTKEL